MRVPAKNKVPDRPDAVASFFSVCDTMGAPLHFGVRTDYRGRREVLEEQGGPSSDRPEVESVQVVVALLPTEWVEDRL